MSTCNLQLCWKLKVRHHLLADGSGNPPENVDDAPNDRPQLRPLFGSLGTITFVDVNNQK